MLPSRRVFCRWTTPLPVPGPSCVPLSLLVYRGRVRRRGARDTYRGSEGRSSGCSSSRTGRCTSRSNGSLISARRQPGRCRSRIARAGALSTLAESASARRLASARYRIRIAASSSSGVPSAVDGTGTDRTAARAAIARTTAADLPFVLGELLAAQPRTDSCRRHVGDPGEFPVGRVPGKRPSLERGHGSDPGDEPVSILSVDSCGHDPPCPGCTSRTAIHCYPKPPACTAAVSATEGCWTALYRHRR